MSNAVDRPGLAVVEQVVEARVRLLGGAEAGELPHRPEPAAVHRRVDAARERIRAGVAEVALVVDVHRVGRLERLVLDPRDRGEELALPLRDGVVQLLAPLAGRASASAARSSPCLEVCRMLLRSATEKLLLARRGNGHARRARGARPWSRFGTRYSTSPRACGKRSRGRGCSVASRRDRATPRRRPSRGRAARRHCRGFATTSSSRRPRTRSAPSSRRRRTAPGTRTSTGTPIRTCTPMPAPPALRAVRSTSAGRSPGASPRRGSARTPTDPTPPGATTTARVRTRRAAYRPTSGRAAARRAGRAPGPSREPRRHRSRACGSRCGACAALPATSVARAGQTTSPPPARGAGRSRRHRRQGEERTSSGAHGQRGITVYVTVAVYCPAGTLGSGP